MHEEAKLKLKLPGIYWAGAVYIWAPQLAEPVHGQQALRVVRHAVLLVHVTPLTVKAPKRLKGGLL